MLDSTEDARQALTMASFSPDHPRLVAIEFFLTHLMADRCMEADDPVAAARTLKEAGDGHAFDLLKIAADDQQRMIATQIGAALATLADLVAAEVERRPANSP